MRDETLSDDIKKTVWRNENGTGIGFNNRKQLCFPYRILGQNKAVWAVGPGIKLDKDGILHDGFEKYLAKDGVPFDIINSVFVRTLLRARKVARLCVDDLCGEGTFDRIPRDRQDIMTERTYQLGSKLFYTYQFYIYALVSGDLKTCLAEGKVYYRSPGSSIPRESCRSRTYADAEKKALFRDPRDYSYSAKALRTLSAISTTATNDSISKTRQSSRLPPRGTSQCSCNGSIVSFSQRLPARVRITGNGVLVRADSFSPQLVGQPITYWNNDKAYVSTRDIVPFSGTNESNKIKDDQKITDLVRRNVRNST